jgi:hypothetical protein
MRRAHGVLLTVLCTLMLFALLCGCDLPLLGGEGTTAADTEGTSEFETESETETETETEPETTLPLLPQPDFPNEADPDGTKRY